TARIKEIDDARNARQGNTLSVPTTAVALEGQARLSPTAEEAHSLYKTFFSDTKVPPDEKKAAEARLAYWENAASKNLIRLGTDWVSRDEAQSKRNESQKLVVQAIALARTNIPSAKTMLERASRVNPEGISASFLLGVIEGGIAGNLQQSRIAFSACAQRRPNDPSLLNNLAVTEAMLGDHLDAVNHFRTALNIGSRQDAVFHNVRRVIAQAASNNLAMPSSAASTYKNLITLAEG